MATTIPNSSTTTLQSNTNIQKSTNAYPNCIWLRKRLTGSDREIWRRVRKICLLEKPYSKHLSWLNVVGYLKSCKSPNSNNKTDDYRKSVGKTEAPNDGHNSSLKTLIICIVTQWKIDFINHDTYSKDSRWYSKLTQECLCQFPENAKLSCFKDIKHYQDHFNRLLYHALWASILRDYHSAEISIHDRRVTIDDIEIIHKHNLKEDEDVALIVGTTKVTFNDSFIHLNNILRLFDFLLIEIDKKTYFGIVVCVQQLAIKDAEKKQNGKHQYSTTLTNDDFEPIKIKLDLNVGIYVSKECADAVRKQTMKNSGHQLDVVKVTSITSTARMIIAVDKMSTMPQFRSLLQPTTQDKYFQIPEHEFDCGSNQSSLKDFNENQLKIINIAHAMSTAEHPRLHMVWGPPGTGKSRTIAGIILQLLPNLYCGHKLLICAPSNGACDELMRRILDEIHRQDFKYEQGTLIRIGARPPPDENLCDYFYQFMVHTKVFQMIKSDPRREKFDTINIGKKILTKAKVIVSTLNYCASSLMTSLKDNIDFVIIDEACQALEPDCLNAFHFGCNNIILVGDHKQLPPTVMSHTSKDYGLDQSLYDRLYSIFNHQQKQLTMLKVQYRMHLNICDLANKLFYGNQLKTSSSVDDRVPNYPYERVFFYELTDATETRDGSNSYWNEKEGLFVKELAEKLMQYVIHGAQSNRASSIAIITPYNAQLRYLRSILPPEIEVMTVDGAQGQERDFIILSCVRDSKNVGFCGDPRRLNVALTRAREAVYIIGKPTQYGLNDEPCWKQIVNYAQNKLKQLNPDIKKDFCELPLIE